MGLDCTFYNVSDDPKTYRKTLGNAIHTRTDIKPYRKLSDLECVITLEYNADAFGCNYVALGEKYYFVFNRERLIGGMMNIYLKIDVLMSYDLKNVPVLVSRSSNVINPYIFDKNQPFEVRCQHYNVPFSGDVTLDYAHASIVAGIIGNNGDPDNDG